jgi:hypothetical protein
MVHKTKNTSFLAMVLFGLFLAGLSSQFLHQFNNKAQVPTDCSNVDHHFHQDPDIHHCDLCDFKLTSFPMVQIPYSSPKWIISFNISDINRGIINYRLYSSNRAPPAA